MHNLSLLSFRLRATGWPVGPDQARIRCRSYTSCELIDTFIVRVYRHGPVSSPTENSYWVGRAVASSESASAAYPIPAQLGRLRRDVDPVQAGGVFAQDLALDLESQIHVVLLFQVLRQLERHELLDQPLGGPDGIVAAEAQLVRAEPEQQIGHDLAKISGPEIDKGHCHRQPGEDVGFLRGDPAEIVQPGQTDVLHDKIEIGKIRGGVIDVTDIECVGAQRVHGWTLMDVDVLDPQFLAQGQIFVGPGVVESPAARAIAPLGRVELEPLDRVLRYHPAKRI